MRIHITPGQGLYLFGPFNIHETLSWQEVVQNERLMFDYLLSANLTYQHLYNLQPDVSQWISANRVGLHNCPQMVNLWNAQAISDFKADLCNICGMQWPAETMIKVGVEYDDLVAIGLTEQLMTLFTHLTLLGWAQLGFTRDDASAMSEAACTRLFGLPKTDVLRSLRSRKEIAQLNTKKFPTTTTIPSTHIQIKQQ
jgi:hypothetical protein